MSASNPDPPKSPEIAAIDTTPLSSPIEPTQEDSAPVQETQNQTQDQIPPSHNQENPTKSPKEPLKGMAVTLTKSNNNLSQESTKSNTPHKNGNNIKSSDNDVGKDGNNSQSQLASMGITQRQHKFVPFQNQRSEGGQSEKINDGQAGQTRRRRSFEGQVENENINQQSQPQRPTSQPQQNTEYHDHHSVPDENNEQDQSQIQVQGQYTSKQHANLSQPARKTVNQADYRAEEDQSSQSRGRFPTSDIRTEPGVTPKGAGSARFGDPVEVQEFDDDRSYQPQYDEQLGEEFNIDNRRPRIEGRYDGNGRPQNERAYQDLRHPRPQQSQGSRGRGGVPQHSGRYNAQRGEQRGPRASYDHNRISRPQPQRYSEQYSTKAYDDRVYQHQYLQHQDESYELPTPPPTTNKRKNNPHLDQNLNPNKRGAYTDRPQSGEYDSENEYNSPSRQTVGPTMRRGDSTSEDVVERQLVPVSPSLGEGDDEEHHDTSSQVEMEVDEDYEIVAEFDPTLPIERFNIKSELVDKWDQITQNLEPYLKEMNEEIIAQAVEQTCLISATFYQMLSDRRKSLEEGCKAIEKEEAEQESARETIRSFIAEMNRCKKVLGNFGDHLNTHKGGSSDLAKGQGPWRVSNPVNQSVYR